MAASIEDREISDVPTDAERDLGVLAVSRVAVWQPPYENTEAMRRDARAWLQVWLSRQHFDRERVVAWLMRLGALCNSPRIDGVDAATKVYAYIEALADYPAACFCIKSAGMAARCDGGFFPSFAKLTEFLDDHRKTLVTRAERMMAITDGKTSLRIGPARLAEPAKRVPPTEEEAAAVAETMRKMRETVGKTPFRASLRPEDDHKGFQPIARTRPPMQVSGVPGQEFRPARPSDDGGKSDMTPKTQEDTA